MSQQPDLTIECPCCGDDACYGQDGELVTDGQPLMCGCKGHMSVDSESEPEAWVDDACDCGW